MGSKNNNTPADIAQWRRDNRKAVKKETRSADSDVGTLAPAMSSGTEENRVAVMSLLKGDQPEAFKAMSSWLKKPASAGPFIQMGYPGTGKTWLTRAIAELHREHSFLFTAPTNKATQQLGLALKGEYVCKTTYSALSLRITNTNQHRRLEQGRDPSADLKGISVLVVDEGSMVAGDEGMDIVPEPKLLDYLLRASKTLNVKLLFLCDPKQLPPPDSSIGESPIFATDWERNEMTQVLRHGGKLLDYVTAFRNNMGRGKPMLLPTDFGFPLLPSYTNEDIITDLDDYLSGDLKYIAWTNKAVDQLNFDVRLRHFGGGCEEVMVGDRVIFTAPLFAYSAFKDLPNVAKNPSAWENDKKFQMVAPIDSSAEVVKVESVTKWGIPAWKCAIRIEGKQNAIILYPRHEGAVKVKNLLKDLSTQARAAPAGQKRRLAWKRLFNFQQAFAPLKFGYGLTAHRAQGSTFSKVLFDLGDINKNRDRQTAERCAYVAMSRAAVDLRGLWRT